MSLGGLLFYYLRTLHLLEEQFYLLQCNVLVKLKATDMKDHQETEYSSGEQSQSQALCLFFADFVIDVYFMI